jgi:flagellar hook-basal body complex protein FliE
MSLIGSATQVAAQRIRFPQLDAAEAAAAKPPPLPAGIASTGPATADFSSVFEKMVSAVDSKQAEAAATTRAVLMGDNDQLHQSVIAMQEASVAFQLMVEVRNKVVEGYQELMRMPV